MSLRLFKRIILIRFPVSCKPLGTLFGVDGELLERQYRKLLERLSEMGSLFLVDWLLEKNIGAYVGIDEVCLSRGELYTILINKEKMGRSGSIIAIVKGTDGARSPPYCSSPRADGFR